MKHLSEDVKKELGGPDVLVNNAGIPGPTAPVSEYDAAAWNAVFNVNLNGTFNVTQHAIPLLKESDQASIIIAGEHARTISGQAFSIDGDSKAAQ